MGIHGAYECTRLTLRSEIRVDLKEAVARNPDKFAGQTGGSGIRRLCDENDIHIGDVVQLFRTALAHGDYGQAC